MDSYDESWPIKMEFTFETTYHQKAAVTMSEVLRKTVRRKRSQWGHVFVWIAIASVLLITLPSGKKVLSIDIKTVIIESTESMEMLELNLHNDREEDAKGR